MKKILSCVLILFMCISVFPQYINASGTSMEVEYIFNNDFESESELSEWNFSLDSGNKTPVVADGQLQIGASAGIFYPNMIRETDIAADKSFIIEYKLDSIGMYCGTSLYLNSTDAMNITSDVKGEYALVVDRESGIKRYRNGEFLSYKTVGFSGAVTSVKFSTQNYKESITKLDYIRAYEFSDDFSVLNKESTALEYIDITLDPIFGDVDLKSCISVSDAEIKDVEKTENGAYRVYFEAPLVPASEHTVTLSPITAKYEITVEGSKTFTARAKRKNIRVEFADEDFSMCTGDSFDVDKKLNINIINEIDAEKTDAVVIVVAYGKNGKMTDIEFIDVDYVTNVIDNIDFNLTNENFCGDMTLELYAVDNIDNLVRVGEKVVYEIKNLEAEKSIEPQKETSGISVLGSYERNLDDAILNVSIKSDNDTSGEVSLVVLKGYDGKEENAPVYSKENIYYLRHTGASSEETVLGVKMPDAFSYYDLYLKSDGNEDVVIDGVMFYSAKEAQNAFSLLNEAKISPDSGEKSFFDTVKEVGFYFSVEEYSEDICNLAARLRDEKGGFENNSDISDTFRLAELIYTKDNGNVSDFIEKIDDKCSFNEDVFDIYESRTGADAKNNILKAVSETEFENLCDIKEKFEWYVVRFAIKYAEHYSQVEAIIESLGEDFLDLPMNEYNKCDKDEINKDLAGEDFETLKDLQNKFDDLLDKYKPSKKPSSKGGSGGSGVRGSSSPMTTEFDSAWVSTQEEKQNKELNKMNFDDIDGVPWAYDAINALWTNGIINGTGNNKFSPDANITRGEIAKIICLALELDQAGDNKFEDINENDWYHTFVTGVANSKIMNGISKTEFGAEEEITREMLATVLFRAVNYKGKTIRLSQEEFADFNITEDYAKESVLALKGAGIVNGKNGNMFEPKSFCTRAEAAKMIYGVLEYIK